MSRRGKRFLGRGVNLPLVSGLLSLAVLLIIAVFPGWAAPKGPEESVAIIVEYGDDDRPMFTVPPYAPRSGFPLGSDFLGRDVVSRMMWGARYTLGVAAAVALLRLLLAVPLGLGAGWWGGALESGLSVVAAGLGSLPALVLAAVLLKISISFQLSVWSSAGLFVAVLTLVGWPRLADTVRQRVKEVMALPYIEAASALGARPGRIVWRHIVPQLLPSLAVISALELGQALLLMAGLGIFQVWVGGGTLIETLQGWEMIPFSGEWGGSMSWARHYLRSAPWVPLVPALGFFWAMGTANLVAEGLRRRWQSLG